MITIGFEDPTGTEEELREVLRARAALSGANVNRAALAQALKGKPLLTPDSEDIDVAITAQPKGGLD